MQKCMYVRFAIICLSPAFSVTLSLFFINFFPFIFQPPSLQEAERGAGCRFVFNFLNFLTLFFSPFFFSGYFLTWWRVFHGLFPRTTTAAPAITTKEIQITFSCRSVRQKATNQQNLSLVSHLLIYNFIWRFFI